MADTDPYAQGRDARRRGCALRDNPHAPGTPYARWDAGWHDEDALLRPCDIPKPKPKPKIVQIVAMAGGEQGLPALLALRDDGTLWGSLVMPDGSVGKEWRMVRPIPDEETSDGR